MAASAPQSSCRVEASSARPALAALVFLICVPGVAGCRKNEFQAPPPPAVTVARPVVQDVVQYAEFTGTTQPYRDVEVRARVEGVLTAIDFAEGRLLQQGDPMFAIDPAPFAAARDAAAAEVDAAEARAVLADTTAKKLESAYAQRAVSEIQAVEARAQHAVAAAQVEVARKQLAIRELDLAYTRIAAPVAGRALRTEYKVGSLVGGLGSGALTRVVDDAKIELWFNVPDRVVLRMREKYAGQNDPTPEVELAREGDADYPFEGRVDYVDPEVDETTGTLRVRAVFDNADRRLLGGLFARVRVAVGEYTGALLVPEVALAADQVGRHLLVVGAGDVVERRAVELGPLLPAGRVVLKGLQAEDRVVVSGLLSARPGAKVRPEQADPTAGDK